MSVCWEIDIRGQEEPAILISRFLIITHAWHVCSQHSFGLPLRMYGMRKIQSVFTHVAGIYANLFEQRKAFTKKKFNSHGTGLEDQYSRPDVMCENTLSLVI